MELPTTDNVRHIAVYATPYAYSRSGHPLYIEYKADNGAPVITNGATEPRGQKRPLDLGPNRKARLVWTDSLHAAFVRAVHTLGVDKAQPSKIKNIMDKMGVHSLTRENVASHLQKYRDRLKRESKRRRLTYQQSITPPPLRLELNTQHPDILLNNRNSPHPPLPPMLTDIKQSKILHSPPDVSSSNSVLPRRLILPLPPPPPLPKLSPKPVSNSFETIRFTSA